MYDFLESFDMIQTKDLLACANSLIDLTNLSATCSVNNILKKHVLD